MQAHSRKRPAPGTSPIPNQDDQTSFPGVSDASQLSNDQFLSWEGNDFSAQNQFPYSNNQRIEDQNNQASNQLVRWNTNQQLAARGQSTTPLDTEAWSDYNLDGAPSAGKDGENEAELEERAAVAKRDALSKRPPKQIPPFIQKLNVCLVPENADLIRWSPSGNSFIVVDEDRFTRTLIPEHFKHKNYPSFVRQLNMYGFHKKVGLSDNSMRASERKTKARSEYEHRYFRRGRPDLLWLIEKTKTKSKKHSEHAEVSDDEKDDPREPSTEENARVLGNKDLITVPKAELNNLGKLQKDVETLQKSQHQIYSILARMRDENNQYIRQASQMVANHERHESSINAILTFLATFYSQSLDGGGNTGNMFGNTIPTNQPQGSVVDVVDYNDNQMQQSQPQSRRPLALLPPPSNSPEDADDRDSSRESSSTPRQSNQQSQRAGMRADANNGNKLASDNSTISPLENNQMQNSFPSNNKNSQILDVINRTNANKNANSNSPSSPYGQNFDVNTALQHYQNSSGQRPLTPEQRDKMLSLMANKSGTSTPSVTNMNSGQNTAAPYLDYFNSNQEQLDMLQRLQEEQDNRVQELAGRLSPLSPNGSIPGLQIPNTSQTGSNNNQHNSSASAGEYFPNTLPTSDSMDFNNFINNDYLDPNNPDLGANFDFNLNDFGNDPGSLPGIAGGDDSGGNFNLNNLSNPNLYNPAFENERSNFWNENNIEPPDTLGGATSAQNGGRFAGSFDDGGHAVSSASAGTNSSGAPTPAPTVEDDLDDLDGDEGIQSNKRRRMGSNR